MLIFPTTVNATVTLREKILNNNEVRTGANFSIPADNSNRDTQEGLFRIAYDGGTAYFFRGTHDGLNNNVIFAGHQWRILRIEGNGNIRMILNGTEAQFIANGRVNTLGGATGLGQSAFNEEYTHNRFVGYMFGSEAGTFNQQHANTYSSTIKQKVDNWFSGAITGENRSFVATETIFCSDRSFASDNEGTGLGQSITRYGSWDRLTSPTLNCPRPQDRLSINNGLTYPVALMTFDEALMAGAEFGILNHETFIANALCTLTMTPSQFRHSASFGVNTSYIKRLCAGSGNGLASASIRWPHAQTRPVLSIRGNILFTGDGSATNPYRFTELYEPEPPIPPTTTTIPATSVPTTTPPATEQPPIENPPTNFDTQFLLLILFFGGTIISGYLIKKKNIWNVFR